MSKQRCVFSWPAPSVVKSTPRLPSRCYGIPLAIISPSNSTREMERFTQASLFLLVWLGRFEPNLLQHLGLALEFCFAGRKPVHGQDVRQDIGDLFAVE